MFKRLRKRVPEWLAAAPDMPQLMHRYLQQVANGELEVRIASADLRTLADNSQRNARIAVCLGLGVVSALGAVALQLFDTHAPRLAGFSSAAIVLALAAAWSFIAALRSR